MLNMAGCCCQIVWVVVLKEQFLGTGISCQKTLICLCCLDCPMKSLAGV